MEHSLADELYSESLQLSRIKLDSTSSANNHDNVELLNEDGPLWDVSDDELDRASDLDREWQRRHDQFHTIGYRDGLIAGKEISSQEGFNIGFKQSVLVGYKWGIVRGVTSALACLPDGLRERLIQTEEQRTQFQGLYESVHSLSTTDALRLFNNEVMAKKAREQRENAETASLEAGLQEQRSDPSALGNYFAELRSLLLESPAVKVNLS